MIGPERGAYGFVVDQRAVDHQFKGASQIGRRFFCQIHAGHINGQKFLNGRAFIHRARIADNLFMDIDGDMGIANGIIDAVMNILKIIFIIAHTRTVRIDFIRNDQCGGNNRNRLTASLIMIAHGGADHHHFMVGHSHLRQDGKEQGRAGLRMRFAIDQVPDVMHPPGYLAQLDQALIIAEFLQRCV